MLCWNCFREKDTEGACPHCGYDGAEQLERFPLALRPGSILNGQYIVGRVLGQGGFGITYLALNDRTKERVSIKEYYPVEFVGRTQDGCSVAVHSADRREDFNYGKEQFLAEARTLAAVTGSDSILRIYSYFEENGTAYFSMEYIEGRPLDAHLKGLGRPLRAQEAEDLFLPLMTALETVHKKGIIHRDIAPDNIIVTPNGLAKLIDFGAARYSTGEKSKSLDVILKHGFAPMEQYTRRGRQGPWTDVYAMAATYYFSVTGKVPPDAIDRITGDTLEKPSELGVNLGKATEAVLLKALAVQAPERWQSMGEFRAALQAAAMAEAEERKKAEQERLAREQKEREARERAERLEREKREKAERAAQKKAEREAARAARRTEKPAPESKKKNPLPLILAAAAVLALVIFGATKLTGKSSPALPAPPAETQAAEPTATPAPITVEENGLTYTVYADHAEVTAADKELTTVKVPDAVEGKPVTSIGHWAFQECRALTSITLPEGLTSIGNTAFANCNALTAIALPESLTSIGSEIFSISDLYQKNLRIDISIHAPAGSYAAEFFKDDPRLVIDPPVPFTAEENGLTFTIRADHAELTAADKELASVEIPGVVEGRPVTGIGDNAFWNCTQLTGITLPEGLTGIGDSAFLNCAQLTDLILPEGLTSIGDGAFTNCTHLTGITIPAGVAQIGNRSFVDCTGLTSITLPEGVTSIGESAFSGCTGLTGIHAQADSYAAEYFKDDPRLVIDPPVPFTVEENGLTFTIQADHAELTAADKSLTSVTVPDRIAARPVTAIGQEAFRDCTALTRVTLPESVKSLGIGAFYNCTELTGIKLPAGVKSLGNSAFYGCTQLTDMTIPEGVTSIQKSAFYGCSRLTGIALPEGLTGIGDMAFYGCGRLTSIALPEGVTSIRNYAFAGCTSLASITLPEGLTSIGNNAFAGCTRLSSITLPEGVTSIGDNTFSGCTSLSSITLPEGVTSIGSYALSGCTGLTSITLPKGLTKIGFSAFFCCDHLAHVTLPEGLISIGEKAFFGCSGLKEIALPKSLRSILSGAFDGSVDVERKPLDIIIHAPAGSYAAEFFKDDPRLVIDG